MTPPSPRRLSSRVSNRFPPARISYFRDSDGSYSVYVIIVLSFAASVSQLPFLGEIAVWLQPFGDRRYFVLMLCYVFVEFLCT